MPGRQASLNVRSASVAMLLPCVTVRRLPVEWQKASTWQIQIPPNPKRALACSIVRFLEGPLLESG